jgi:ketosteroid isomerase-like protein
VAKADREIVEQLYARWNADEPELALDLLDDNVDIHQNPDLLDTARTFRGREGLVEAAREIAQAFSRTDWRVEAWIDEGDWLIARVEVLGTGRVSGATQSMTVAHCWKLRDGLITHFYVYPTVSDAVRALQAIAAGQTQR